MCEFYDLLLIFNTSQTDSLQLIDPSLRRNGDAPVAVLISATNQSSNINNKIDRDAVVYLTDEDRDVDDVSFLGAIEGDPYSYPGQQKSFTTGSNSLSLNVIPTQSPTANQTLNIDTNKATADFKAPPKRKSKPRPGVNPPYKLRREWGLYQVALTGQELSQIREGYHLPGMRLEVFQTGVNRLSSRRTRVRLTLAEYTALKKLRNGSGGRLIASRRRSNGPTHEERVKASEILEEYLKKKVAGCRAKEDDRLRRINAEMNRL